MARFIETAAIWILWRNRASGLHCRLQRTSIWKNLLRIYLFLAVGAAAMLSCSLSPISTGGGTDFPNTRTIYGKINNTDGTAALNTQVKLMAQDFNPGSDTTSPRMDTTDVNGIYRFENVDTGTYSILAVHMEQRSRVLFSGIHVAIDTAQNQSALAIPAGTVWPSGTIRVAVTSDFDTINGYFYIPGTNITVRLNGSTASVALDSVPAGTIPAIYYGIDNTPIQSPVRFNVQVEPGATALVTNPGWQFSKQVVLNTSASGAMVTGTVTNFPVLIRLRADNFNFNEVRANGDDILFVKDDNTPLPFEIERWDAANRQAEIWVAVDTIYGNNATQHFVMYWGKATASARSCSAAVFDTANGFQGVWHMNQSGKEIISDATANHYNGTQSSSGPLVWDGAIGLAQKFDGCLNSITIQNSAKSKLEFPQNGPFTVSAWVCPDTIDGKAHFFISKGDRRYTAHLSIYNNWVFGVFQDMVGNEKTYAAASGSGAWEYFVGVRSGASQYLYMNGTCVDSTITLDTLAWPLNSQSNVILGASDGYASGFSGKIDEIRMSSIARGPDWIRLSFMNQKPEGDELVVFK